MPHRSVAQSHQNYRHTFSQLWENYNLIEFYAPLIMKQISKGILPLPKLSSIFGPERTLTASVAANSFKSMSDRHNGYVYFVYLISSFEQCISDAVYITYTAKPELIDPNLDQTSVPAQDTKILKMILESSDYKEIIDKVVEERIRGIFYGNPMDIFEKDKCRMKIGSWFKDNAETELQVLREAILRRNLIVHNNGRVDRRYLRETGLNWPLGKKLDIDKTYMKQAISVVINISGCFSALIVRQIFQEKPIGWLGEKLKRYERKAP